MTDSAHDPNRDLAAALRRELAGTAVPHDDSRAEAMIEAATAADLLATRSWPAPLAAAAAVVVIGGGAATFAATHGGGGAPSGGAPVVCPSAPSTPAVPAPLVDDPCDVTASPSAPYPVPLPGSFEMTAVAGTTSVSTVLTSPAVSTSPLYVVQYDRLSGTGGTVRTEQGSTTVSVHDITDDGDLTYLGRSPYPSSRLILSCTGRTTCRVRLTISKTVPVGSPGVTAAPTR